MSHQAYEKASGQSIPYTIVEPRAGDVASCYAGSGFFVTTASRYIFVREWAHMYELCWGLLETPSKLINCFIFLTDPSKALAELKWKTELGIEQMCADSWAWQSRNPFGYAGVGEAS